MIERHLRFFLVVAEEQHVQRAAARLGMTQSALSRRIQILEQEMGVVLFDRLPRGIRLSPAGLSFYADMRKFKQDLDQAAARARNISLGSIGRLNIGLTGSATQDPAIGRGLTLFRTKFPDVDVRIQVMFSEEQMGALESGQLDVGVIYQFSELPWASYQVIAVSELWLAMPKSHPLAKRRTLRLKDLQESSFIWPTREFSPKLYDRMIAACSAGGLTPTIVMEMRNSEAILSLVAIGVGCAFVDSQQAENAPTSVVIHKVRDFSLQLPLSLAWRSDNKSPALQRCLSVFPSPLARM
jgi:DNA-binding transcriptional LysR family regulator